MRCRRRPAQHAPCSNSVLSVSLKAVCSDIPQDGQRKADEPAEQADVGRMSGLPVCLGPSFNPEPSARYGCLKYLLLSPTGDPSLQATVSSFLHGKRSVV